MFLTQKINNFLIFIKEKIGDDNSVYRDFQAYANDLNSFLTAFVQLNQVGINEQLIRKYLDAKGIKKEVKPEDFKKIMAYFNMFAKVINS